MRIFAFLAAVLGMTLVLAGCNKPVEPQTDVVQGPVYLPPEEDEFLPPPPPQPQPKTFDNPPPAPPAGAAGVRNYTVQKGDTLYKIAREQLGGNSRVNDIKPLNPEITNWDVLKIGQVIKIPAK